MLDSDTCSWPAIFRRISFMWVPVSSQGRHLWTPKAGKCTGIWNTTPMCSEFKHTYAVVCVIHGFPRWLRRWRICLQCRRPRFSSKVGKIPWRRKWQPTPYSCLENPMDRGAWRASPWGREEPNTTGRLTLWNLDVHLRQCLVQSPPSGGIWRIKEGRDGGVNYRR